MLWKVIANIFWQYIKEHLFYVFFLNVLFIATSITNNLYLSKIYGQLYDMFKENLNTFMYAFIFILILKASIYLIYQFEEYFFSIQRLGIEEAIQKYIITKINEKYQRNPEEIIIGEQLSAIFKIQKTFGMWFSKIFQYLVPYIFVIISSAIYMYSIDKYLPVYLILLAIGSFLTIFTNIYFCSNICYKSNDEYLKLYQVIEDYLSNLLTIHTYNQFDTEGEKLNKQSKIFQEANKSIEKCTLTGHLIGVAIVILFMFLTMYHCYKLLLKGVIKKSQIMGIYFLIMSMLGSLIYLNDMFHDLSIEYHNINNIENIGNLHLFTPFDENKVIVEYPRIQTNTLIKFVNVDYKYPGSNYFIIEKLNLEINKGERVALIGNIGSGKSTILKLILGMLKPTNGDLYLEEKNYKILNQQDDIFKRIGYMTQNPILFNRTILDNILFSNPDISRKDVVELLEYFGLNKVFSKLEKGIDSEVGKNGSRLSGGQKQVIWFLRIYFKNPDILLLDEPTASLSKQSKKMLWNLIEKGFKGKTIIMSSHDEFLINLSTRKVKIGG